MKVETSVAKMLTITGAKALDPIRVILEDIESGRGRITISCYTKSWVSYWGSIGKCTVAEFFISCNASYLAGCLAPHLNSELTDADSVRPAAIRAICEQRRSGDLKQSKAREMMEDAERIDGDLWAHSDILTKIFGDEWFLCLPSRSNPDYLYLCRIIDAVKEALTIVIANEKTKEVEECSSN